MAIDIKSILGATKSTIMTPAEIAQLGMRRKAMAMQQENIEFNRVNSQLNTLENYLANADSLEEFQTGNQSIARLMNETNDPTLKAKSELIMSHSRDDMTKLSNFQTAHENFKAYNDYEYNQLFSTDSTDHGVGQINDKVWNKRSQERFRKDVKDLTDVENIQFMAEIAKNKAGLSPRKLENWTTYREGVSGSDSTAGVNYRKYYDEIRDLKGEALQSYLDSTPLSSEAKQELKRSFSNPEERKKAIATIMAESGGDHSKFNKNKGQKQTTTELWENIKAYKQNIAVLGSKEYSKFMTPELQAEIAAKSDHYGAIKAALTTGNIITEEEWNVIENGDLESFLETKKTKMSHLTNIIKDQKGNLGTLKASYDKMITGDMDDEDWALQGIDTQEKKQAYLESLVRQMDKTELQLEESDQMYEVWSGESLLEAGDRPQEYETEGIISAEAEDRRTKEEIEKGRYEGPSEEMIKVLTDPSDYRTRDEVKVKKEIKPIDISTWEGMKDVKGRIQSIENSTLKGRASNIMGKISSQDTELGEISAKLRNIDRLEDEYKNNIERMKILEESKLHKGNSEFADEYNRLVKATKNRRNKIDLPRYLSKRKQTNLKNSLKEQQKLLQGILNQSEAAKIARSE